MNTICVCNICAETVDKTRPIVACMYCNYEACRECCKTWLLSKVTVGCMNNQCLGEWSMKFVATRFNKSFVDGDFRQHRETIHFETEKALLPATQPAVEAILAIETELSARPPIEPFPSEPILTCIRIYSQIAILGECPHIRDKFEGVTDPKILKKCLNGDFKFLKAMRRELKHSKNVAKGDLVEFHRNMEVCQAWTKSVNDMDALKHRINFIRESELALPKTPQVRIRQFIKACPKDDCRGFLSTQWQCGLCQCKVCSKCHVLKTDTAEHTCNPDDVATAEFLIRDTKPCPKCATPIHKINGCDQMWCVCCQTAFSWRTGELVHGNIHNPHFFDYLQARARTQGGGGGQERNPNDIVCGREVTGQFMAHLSNRFYPSEAAYKTAFQDFQRNYFFLKYELIHYPVHDAMDNRKHRIAYLKQEIDEPTFKKRVFLRNKHNDINREIRMWLLLLRDIWSELCFNLNDKLVVSLGMVAREDLFQEFFTEVAAAEELANQNLKELCELFKIKTRAVNYRVNHDEWYIKPCH